MIVLGIDPGPKRCALAWLGFGGAKATVLSATMVETSDLLDNPVEHIRARDNGHTPWLISIEWPQYRPIGGRMKPQQSLAMAKSLVETALVAAEVKGRLVEGGREVVTPTCGQIRKAILGRPSANDAEVKWALAHFVELPKRSNAHTRDAMAAATVGIDVWNPRGRQLDVIAEACGHQRRSCFTTQYVESDAELKARLLGRSLPH